MSSMKAYLAEKYMSGPKADAILERAAPKKRKRKAGTSSTSHLQSAGASGSSSSFVKDDDGGWGDESKADDDDEEAAQAVVASDRGFKKRKAADSSTGWTTLREGDNAMAELDRNQASRDREKEEIEAEDEKPTVVDAEPAKSFVGGLVSAKDLTKALRPKTVEAKMTKEQIEAAQETIHRDSSGRKIDEKAERAEAARKKRQREEKDAERMEWGKGIAQREEKEKMKKDAERNRHKGFSRTVDDKELNEDLKSKDLWNDPAAMFMSKKRSKGPRRPEYNGPPPPPNRFNLKPGYRWDGVDRGNGFETKYFQSLNSKKRLDLESYQWGAEDM
ncbi:Pre-mRNA-splicing factor of RES complex-domain-containing protein [Pterulicium gracile]|uniref:Pre-mRNA-splicing factor of RES complex-domain-containing protein n=1 Tax=Pterulicium gracile TaxID=1884261 RepID=A0A5C3QHE9_9AGAR|nr:Pre-mRNA-splicing factor of RES complex-domain-containing protein [Pterula gracilis]